MSKNEARKRDAITFMINAQVRKSAASCRFVEEFRESNEHAAKREKVIAALRSGQMLEEAGLQPVLAFLDTEGFENLDVRERQLLVLARLQDYLGVSPQSAPAAVPVEVSPRPPAAEQAPSSAPPAQQVESQKAEEASPPAPAPKTSDNTQLGKYASKLSG